MELKNALELIAYAMGQYEAEGFTGKITLELNYARGGISTGQWHFSRPLRNQDSEAAQRRGEGREVFENN